MDKVLILFLCILALRFGIARLLGVVDQATFWGWWLIVSSVTLAIITIRDKNIKWWK